MARSAIARTGLLFGAVRGGFALAVQLIGFYIIRDQSPWTSIAGAMLEPLIIGDAGRVQGRASGRGGAASGPAARRVGLNDRGPLLVMPGPGRSAPTTRARWAAAPPAPRGPLLPSGPDGIGGTRLRRTRPSTRSHAE